MSDRGREAMLARGRSGDGEAMYRLAMSYRLGLEGGADSVLAAAWLQAAAKAGHLEAQFLLGLCCYEGDGVRRDRRQAARWFRRAAEGGHLRAQHWLARCAVYGEGCEPDPREAFCWCQIARANGFEGGDELLLAAAQALTRHRSQARLRAETDPRNLWSGRLDLNQRNSATS
jgi:TPR repeat protein